MNRGRAAVVDGVRTPFCRSWTSLAEIPADELGKTAVAALLTRTGIDPEEIDEVIFGCVAQPVDAANLARVIALRAGIPQRIPAITVQRNCASGLEAVLLAAERIAVGRGDCYIAGGVESMSQIPLLFSQRAAQKLTALSRAKGRSGKLRALAALRPADFRPVPALKLGLSDPVCGLNMGETAELLAREWRIGREEQDGFALESHRRATAGRAALQEEICAVYPSSGSAPSVPADNGPRERQTMEALAALRPVFNRKHGTVTAGNASQISDGAVALLVTSEKKAEKLGLQPRGFLGEYAVCGCDPERMGLGPAYAIEALERAAKLSIHDADLVEINEAFAAQVLAVQRALDSKAFCRTALGREKPIGAIDPERLNVTGGAIALGHPVGASGARLVLTALRELNRRDGRSALVSLCVGGGQGAALWLER